jgi:hypothetical protein
VATEAARAVSPYTSPYPYNNFRTLTACNHIPYVHIMNYRDRCIQALHGAESAIRTTIEEALATQAYSDVAFLAACADSLARLIHEIATGQVNQPVVTDPQQSVNAEPPAAAAVAQPGSARSVRVAPPSSKRAYPWYMKDGDRLVKIAWSKKERKPYEHRAPRPIINILIEAIRKKKGDGKIFETAEVLPLKSPSGEEYPSYQSYMALGWLRQVGAIAKKGRDGYVLRPGITSNKLDSLWNAIPAAE